MVELGTHLRLDESEGTHDCIQHMSRHGAASPSHLKSLSSDETDPYDESRWGRLTPCKGKGSASAIEAAKTMSPLRKGECVENPTEGKKWEEGNRELHVEAVEIEVVSWGSRRERRLVEDRTPAATRPISIGGLHGD